MLSRSLWRNILFYDASNDEQLGGLYQAGSLTEENLHWMLGSVLLIVDQPWTLRHKASGRTVLPSNNKAALGEYEIRSNGTIRVTNEQWAPRLISYSNSGQETAFTRDIRARDGRCVISGVVNNTASYKDWTGYQAAHVFPLQYETMWARNGYGCWIREVPDDNTRASLNSVQNGLLMLSHIHKRFDQYTISINPDASSPVFMLALEILKSKRMGTELSHLDRTNFE
ncbi:hypothetical protein BDW42DRAFT_182003 [Aspergillus taichungensis]|uniref:Uncharacterized protein n=1 Tax=Aspergillus taichungensis TaxID=482145 RepID=A0A2J5HCU8_9EURO|nr:hypothetical protein BDW42DRAFT_182003 [Aspergillus taichungensis]